LVEDVQLAKEMMMVAWIQTMSMKVVMAMAMKAWLLIIKCEDRC
jgi:hypothetical protein